MLNSRCVPGCAPLPIAMIATPPCFVCVPSLLAGGDFASDDGWTLTNGASIDGGVLELDGTGAGTALTPSLETLVAGDYAYTFTLVATNGAGPVSVIVGGSSVVVAGSTVPGLYSGTISSTATNQNIGIGAGAGTIVQIDNFIVTKA